MGFADAYRARKQEKLRERLLDEAYTRRATKARDDRHEEEFGLAHREALAQQQRQRPVFDEEEFLRAHRETQARRQHRQRRNSAPRPAPIGTTPPPQPRPTNRRRPDYNPFDTASDLVMPEWLARAGRGGTPDPNTVERSHRIHAAPRYPEPQRAVPDLAPPNLRRYDSLPARPQIQNYHPRHGHRYLREDEHAPTQASIPFVQPLSYGRRAPGETRGYRGRLFGEGNPPRPPPKRDLRPEPVGPPPPGFF